MPKIREEVSELYNLLKKTQFEDGRISDNEVLHFVRTNKITKQEIDYLVEESVACDLVSGGNIRLFFKLNIGTDQPKMPSWLFTSQAQTGDDASSAKRFNPLNAVGGGNAWEASIAPSATLNKKPVIIDSKFLCADDEVIVNRRMGQTIRLVKEGFDVYYKSVTTNEFIKISQVSEMPSAEEVAEFKEQDWERVGAKLLGGKDDIVVMREMRSQKFDTLFCNKINVLIDEIDAMDALEDATEYVTRFADFIGMRDDVSLTNQENPKYLLRNAAEITDEVRAVIKKDPNLLWFLIDCAIINKRYDLLAAVVKEYRQSCDLREIIISAAEELSSAELLADVISNPARWSDFALTNEDLLLIINFEEDSGDENTIALIAARNGNIEALKVILGFSASVLKSHEDGARELSEMVSPGMSEDVERILDIAIMDFPDTDMFRETLFFCASALKEMGDQEEWIVEIVNARNSKGWTILLDLIKTRQLESAIKVIGHISELCRQGHISPSECKSIINVKSWEGETALMLAIDNQEYQLVDILLKAKKTIDPSFKVLDYETTKILERKRDPKLREILRENNIVTSRPRIMLAEGGQENHLADDGDDDVEYVMKEAGKVLNRSQKEIRVRDSVLRIDKINAENKIIFKSQNKSDFLYMTDAKNEIFEGNRVIDTSFSPQDLKIRYGAAKQRERGTFCSFQAKLRLNKLTRLISLDCQEKIACFSLPPEVEIEELHKDEHGFYWVKVKAKDGMTVGPKCEIGYVINIPSESTRAKISANNFIMRDGKEFAKKYSEFTPPAQIEVDPDSGELDKKSWLNDLYRNGQGSCGYRAAAFAHHVKRWDKKPGIDFRIVGINNNHVAIEVYDEPSETWHYLDLGGRQATITNQYDDDPDLDNDEELPEDNLEEDILDDVASDGYEESSSEEADSEAEAEAEDSTELDEDEDKDSPKEDIAAKRDEGAAAIEAKHLEAAIAQSLKSSLSIKSSVATQSTPLSSRAKVQFEKHTPIAKILLSKVKFAPLESQQEIGNIVAKPSAKRNKTLIITKDDQISVHINLLMTAAIKSGREAFCISKPSDIDILKKVIATPQIRSNSSVLLATVQDHGFLQDFLSKRGEQTEPPLIIINWDNFSSKERTALNTILDESATIQGQKADCDIFSLSSTQSQDTSFISRHNILYKSQIELEEKPIEYVNIEQAIEFDERNRKAIRDNILVLPRKTPDASEAERNFEIYNIFDFEGADNWRQKLFGNISLAEDHLLWHRSDFVNQVADGRSKFIFSNISEVGKRECFDIINQANARGYLFYNGTKIIVHDPLEIRFSELQFDFTKFSPSYISACQTTAANIPQDAHIINSSLFDVLLYGKEIAHGKYKETKGLIAQHAENQTEGPLKLFISTDLTTSQYYCLFNQAAQQNVMLQLHLAPNVTLPPEVGQAVRSLDPKWLLPVKNKLLQAEITVSNDVDQIKPKEVRDQDVIVDVEDYSGQDLIEKINFRIDEHGQFVDFERQESDLIKILKAGKNSDRKIVLRGEFTNSLLQALTPILFEDYAKNLVLLIKNKEITQSAQLPKNLEWLTLPERPCHALYKEPISPEEKQARRQQAIKTENTARANDIFSHDLAEQSALFLQERKALFEDSLRDNLVVKFVGASGVGKSYFVNSLNGQRAEISVEAVAAKASSADEEPQELNEGRKRKALVEDAGDAKRRKESTKLTYKTYNSLDDLITISKAIEKGSQNIIHLLFLDESNITDKHFTMFKNAIESAKNQSQKDFEILYQGKLLKFNLKNFRIAFAENPPKYGGGRKKQRLFEDVVVPEIHLQNLPIGVIYQEVLYKNIFLKLPDGIRLIDGLEENFQKECKEIIEQYQQINEDSQDEPLKQQTVRELQEYALRFVVKTLREQAEPQPPKKITSKNFTSSQATATIEESLRDCLEIGKHQRNADFPTCGLNGVLLEGGSGVGKSSIIQAIIDEYKVDFCKIDASTPKEEKKAMILKAFKEGTIIWIDEINSCLDDGLEQILNSVLDGVNPDTGEPAAIKGFKLFASSNQASQFGGRSIIGPALRHRLNCPRVSELKEYTAENVAEIVMNWIEYDDDLKGLAQQKDAANITKEQIVRLSQDFLDLINDPKSVKFNLRDLRNSMEEFLLNLQAENVNDIAMTGSPSSAGASSLVARKDQGLSMA